MMTGEFDVDVVRTRLSDVADLTPFRAVLSADEQSRAAAFKVEEPRDSFVLSRGLLRIELATRLGIDPRDICFELRPSGKPDLCKEPSRPDWRFSVSHTGPHVAIAFALGVDVGIDIEPFDRAVKPLVIAKRYFTPREYATLEATPESARYRAFFAVWTRKEAIVKARGDTMAESLTSLGVDLDPEAEHPWYDDDLDRASCRLTAFILSDLDLIGAVALRSELTPRLRFRKPSNPGFD
jgi:4'-phosphopantetheinyl transferase